MVSTMSAMMRDLQPEQDRPSHSVTNPCERSLLLLSGEREDVLSQRGDRAGHEDRYADDLESVDDRLHPFFERHRVGPFVVICRPPRKSNAIPLLASRFPCSSHDGTSSSPT